MTANETKFITISLADISSQIKRRLIVSVRRAANNYIRAIEI
jgi:hypothetical protein